MKSKHHFMQQMNTVHIIKWKNSTHKKAKYFVLNTLPVINWSALSIIRNSVLCSRWLVIWPLQVIISWLADLGVIVRCWFIEFLFTRLVKNWSRSCIAFTSTSSWLVEFESPSWLDWLLITGFWLSFMLK